MFDHIHLSANKDNLFNIVNAVWMKNEKILMATAEKSPKYIFSEVQVTIKAIKITRVYWLAFKIVAQFLLASSFSKVESYSILDYNLLYNLYVIGLWFVDIAFPSRKYLFLYNKTIVENLKGSWAPVLSKLLLIPRRNN